MHNHLTPVQKILKPLIQNDIRNRNANNAEVVLNTGNEFFRHLTGLNFSPIPLFTLRAVTHALFPGSSSTRTSASPKNYK